MPGRIENDMLNPKRLKGLEVVSVNSTENTYLYFAAPTLEDLEREDEFFDSHESFQPTFTYPFYGQEELWKGVTEGSLTICFDPKTFYAYVSFEVDEDADELKVEILKQLTDKMDPNGWTSNWKIFIEHCNSSSAPEFGILSGQFTLENKSFSIFCVLAKRSRRCVHTDFCSAILMMRPSKLSMSGSNSSYCFTLKLPPTSTMRIQSGAPI